MDAPLWIIWVYTSAMVGVWLIATVVAIWLINKFEKKDEKQK